MKKVVIFNQRWSSGGIESMMVKMIPNLDKEKINITVLAIQKESSVYDNVLAENNVSLRILNEKFEKNPLIRNLKSFKRYKEVLKEIEPDVIHINVYNAISLEFARIAKKYVKKVIVHSHSEGFENDKFKIKLILNKISKLIFASKKFTYIACSTNSAEFCFPKNTKFKILKNGIDIKKYDYDKCKRDEYRAKFKLENSFVIGNIGRFVEQKNQKFLIEVFKKVLEKRENAKLLLIGDGEDKDIILQKIEKLNIKDKVLILSNRNDVENLLQAMDIFVLPSLFEGLPVVAVEAQRKPV